MQKNFPVRIQGLNATLELCSDRIRITHGINSPVPATDMANQCAELPLHRIFSLDLKLERACMIGLFVINEGTAEDVQEDFYVAFLSHHETAFQTMKEQIEQQRSALA